MSTAERMKIERRGNVGTIVLDNAERMNIIDTPSLNRLGALLSELESDGTVRVIILTGVRHFCAGADVRELKEKDPGKAGMFAGLGQGLCEQIEKLPKPVIAAVDGYALGAGCEIALACDLRIASARAKFGQPEISLGLIPGFGGTQRLTRVVGIGRAKDMVLSGRLVDAAEAGAAGLANAVVSDDELLATAGETASLLAKKSPVALRLAKALINEQHETKKGLQKEAAHFAECFSSEDHREGIDAFLEKREPLFKGR